MDRQGSWYRSTNTRGWSKLAQVTHLDLSVPSFQQTDGQLDALLEDLVVLGAHHQIREQLGPSFSIQTTLNGRHRRPVSLLLAT